MALRYVKEQPIYYPARDAFHIVGLTSEGHISIWVPKQTLCWLGHHSELGRSRVLKTFFAFRSEIEAIANDKFNDADVRQSSLSITDRDVMRRRLHVVES